MYKIYKKNRKYVIKANYEGNLNIDTNIFNYVSHCWYLAYIIF